MNIDRISAQRRRYRSRLEADPADFAPRVLLLTSGLGLGHTRVAQAIEAVLLQRGLSSHTIDLWSLMNPAVVSIVHQTYLRLVQNHPDLYERLYHLDEHTWRQILESEDGPPPAVLEVLELISAIAAQTAVGDTGSLRYSSDRLLLSLLCTALPYDGTSLAGNGVRARLALMKWTWLRLMKRLEGSIREFAPDVIVCTQMIPAAMVSSLKQRRKLSAPALGVLTDFGVHDFWRQPGLERYCVAHASLLDAFAATGRAGAARVTGVPLMPAFASPLKQAEARRQVGFAQQGAIVLVLGGGLGLSVEHAAMQLLQRDTGAQLVVMPGHNRAAHQALTALMQRYPSQVRVCGWTERMDIFLRAADVVVGKPGGVSVAESLACGRPWFASRSLGGQEGFNVRFLEQHGVGALAPDADLVARVESLISQPDLLRDMQRRAWALGQRQGAAHVVDLVLDLAWTRQGRLASREH